MSGTAEVRLNVRVTPRARANAVQAFERDDDGPLLTVRLQAPPVDGEANRVLVRFLAEALGLRRSEVEILGGERSRNKVVRLAADRDEVFGRLEDMAKGQ